MLLLCRYTQYNNNLWLEDRVEALRLDGRTDGRIASKIDR